MVLKRTASIIHAHTYRVYSLSMYIYIHIHIHTHSLSENPSSILRVTLISEALTEASEGTLIELAFLRPVHLDHNPKPQALNP